METFVDNIGNTLAWLGMSIVFLTAGFVVVDLMTPGNLREQVSASINAALLVASRLTAVSIIIGSAVWNAPDDLGEGLGQAAGYSALGLVIGVVAFLLLDLALPARLREMVTQNTFNPVAVVTVGADLSVAVVIAAAIS
jgi:uncharacterized membrane protein YjfL (UPF0719 family)